MHLPHEMPAIFQSAKLVLIWLITDDYIAVELAISAFHYQITEHLISHSFTHRSELAVIVSRGQTAFLQGDIACSITL